MPALDAMKLLARYRTMRPFATNDHAAFLGVDVDIVARESGDFSGQNEAAGGFEKIDRWIPSGCVGADKLSDLFMQRKQIAQRIPAGERHLRIVTRRDRYYGCERAPATSAVSGWLGRTLCATIPRIYGQNMASSIQAT